MSKQVASQVTGTGSDQADISMSCKGIVAIRMGVALKQHYSITKHNTKMKKFDRNNRKKNREGLAIELAVKFINHQHDGH